MFRDDAFIPSSSVFPEIDKDRLAREMNLKKIGAERGKSSQPPSDAGTLDHIELDIISRVEALRRRGLENYETNRQVYSGRLTQAGAARQQVETDANDAKSRFNTETTGWRNKMVQPRERVQETYRWRNRFRELNRLERPAKKAASIVNIVGLGLLMVLIESFFNAYLFSQSNPLGLFGGLIAAVLVSVGNVTISTLLGMGSRYINMAGGWRILLKFTGVLFFLFWFAFAAVYNLAVAHFRDAAETVGAWREAGTIAIQTMLDRPFSLQTMESYVLLILGFVISVLALIKGWHTSDPYPGYSKVQQDLLDARASYIDHLDEAVELLEEHRDNAVEDLRAAHEEVQRNINDSVDALYGQRTLTSGVAPFLEQCDIAANYLLAVYRDANRIKRPEGASVPAHFSERHKFTAFTPATVEEFRRKEAEEKVKEVEVLVAKATVAIFDDFNAAVRDHYEIDELEGVYSDRARVLAGNLETRSDASELQVIAGRKGAT